MINILANCCNNNTFLGTIFLIKLVIKIVFIGTPIILIVLITIDLFKNVIASSEEEQKKNIRIIVKRIIYCIAIFFVPAIINLVMNIVYEIAEDNTKKSFVECWNNATAENVKACNEEAEAKEEKIRAMELERTNKIKQEKLERQRAAEEYAKKNNAANNATNNTTTQTGQIGSGQGGAGNCSGSYVGPKYSLTEEQKKKIAGMVMGEYGGDLNGMKAVASQMANLYEINSYNDSNCTRNRTFYEYITLPTGSCGWYATYDKAPTTDADALKAVEDVIINGNRTLPLYINEFDWYPGDINGASSISDSNSYIPGSTKISNIYGSTGTYYCITSSGNDANIYFYTAGAENYRIAKGYSKGY